MEPTGFFVSFDGGTTWVDGQVPSNSGTGFNGDPAPAFNRKFGTAHMAQLTISCGALCGSVGLTVADGTVVVHFANWQNGATWEPGEEYESQLLAVRSTDGGETWSPPVQIAALEDGSGDYPENVDGRNTQTGHQFRTATAAGMTLDEVTGDLWAFWTDNTDGARDVPGVVPVTTTNVFLSQSRDGGRSWSTPIRVTTGNGDRWMPWAGARNGVVRVMYMDGSYDFPARNGYGVTLSTSSNGGLTWTHEPVHTQLSNPDEARYFKAGAAAPGCETCSTFIGDYNGLAIDSLGRTHLVWTDMRRTVTYNSRTGRVEDAIYARR